MDLGLEIRKPVFSLAAASLDPVPPKIGRLDVLTPSLDDERERPLTLRGVELEDALKSPGCETSSAGK